MAQLYPKEVILSQSRSEAESIFLEELVRRMSQFLDKENTIELKSNAFSEHRTGNPGRNVFPSTGRFNFIDPYHFDSEATHKSLKKHFQKRINRKDQI